MNWYRVSILRCLYWVFSEGRLSLWKNNHFFVCIVHRRVEAGTYLRILPRCFCDNFLPLNKGRLSWQSIFLFKFTISGFSFWFKMSNFISDFFQLVLLVKLLSCHLGKLYIVKCWIKFLIWTLKLGRVFGSLNYVRNIWINSLLLFLYFLLL